jgi:hypothetical protein
MAAHTSSGIEDEYTVLDEADIHEWWTGVSIAAADAQRIHLQRLSIEEDS